MSTNPITHERISRLLGAELSWRRIVTTDSLTWLSRGLSLTGFGLAAYLTTVYLQDVPPLCGSSGGCAIVQHSGYANVAGVPMPVLGLAGYSMLLTTACLPGQRARMVGMVFTVLAIGVSIFLTYVELAVIHAICYWCAASAACASLHVIVNSARYVRGETPSLAGAAIRGDAVVPRAAKK